MGVNNATSAPFFFCFVPRAPWQINLITYPQLWLVGINVVYKVKLCHIVLGHMPGSADTHSQVVYYLSIKPMEGGREVSALMQNNRKKNKKTNGNNETLMQSGGKKCKRKESQDEDSSTSDIRENCLKTHDGKPHWGTPGLVA